MAKKEELIYNLTWTKAFFKFGFAHLDSLSDLQFLDIFAYGRHTATKEELELTEEQQNYMPTILQHVSAYILLHRRTQLYKKPYQTDSIVKMNLLKTQLGFVAYCEMPSPTTHSTLPE